MCSVETAEAHLKTYPSRKSEYGPDLAQLIEQGRSMSGVEIAAIHHERLKFSRQPGGIVRGHRPVADPDDARADSDADEDG